MPERSPQFVQLRLSVSRRWERALDVLANHGYADGDVYGECFCKAVHEDAHDMAAHIAERLAEASVLSQPEGWAQ